MKTKEELLALKNEVEALNKKLAGLSDEELKVVCGGDVTSANILRYRVARPAIASVGYSFDTKVTPTNDGNYVPHTYFDTDPSKKEFDNPYADKD